MLTPEEFKDKLVDMQEHLDDPAAVMGVCMELTDAYSALSSDLSTANTNLGKATKQADDLRARNMDLFRQLGERVNSKPNTTEEDNEEKVLSFEEIAQMAIKSKKFK